MNIVIRKFDFNCFSGKDF